MQFVDQVDTPTTDFHRDVPNKRFIHTKYGFDIVLERRDPYGFVHVVWPRGQTPNAIGGAYQTFDLARQAVTNYLESETFNEVVAEAMKPVEPIKYKKRQVA